MPYACREARKHRAHSSCRLCMRWIDCKNPRCPHPACESSRWRAFADAWRKKTGVEGMGNDVFMGLYEPVVPAQKAMRLEDRGMLDGKRDPEHADVGYKLARALVAAEGDWIQPIRLPGMNGESGPGYGAAVADLLKSGIRLQHRSARYQSDCAIAYARKLKKKCEGGLVISEVRLTGGRVPRALLDGSLSDRFPGITESPRGNSAAGRNRRRTGMGAKAPVKARDKAKTTTPAAPRLGKTAEFWLEQQKLGKRKGAAIVEKAGAIAVKRSDRVIRFEYMLIAAGEITERQLGSDQVKSMRSAITRQRVPRKAKATKTTRQARAPQKRQQRQRATAAAAK